MMDIQTGLPKDFLLVLNGMGTLLFLMSFIISFLKWVRDTRQARTQTLEQIIRFERNINEREPLKTVLDVTKAEMTHGSTCYDKKIEFLLENLYFWITKVLFSVLVLILALMFTVIALILAFFMGVLPISDYTFLVYIVGCVALLGITYWAIWLMRLNYVKT